MTLSGREGGDGRAAEGDKKLRPRSLGGRRFSKGARVSRGDELFHAHPFLPTHLRTSAF